MLSWSLGPRRIEAIYRPNLNEASARWAAGTNKTGNVIVRKQGCVGSLRRLCAGRRLGGQNRRPTLLLNRTPTLGATARSSGQAAISQSGHTPAYGLKWIVETNGPQMDGREPFVLQATERQELSL